MAWYDILMSLGATGALAVILTLVMLFIFLRRLLARRRCWRLLWFGVVSATVGLLGMVLGRMEAFSRIAQMGGAAGPGDLAEGIAKSYAPAVVGLAGLLLSVACAAILDLRGVKPSGEEAGPDSRPPR